MKILPVKEHTILHHSNSIYDITSTIFICSSQIKLKRGSSTLMNSRRCVKRWKQCPSGCWTFQTSGCCTTCFRTCGTCEASSWCFSPSLDGWVCTHTCWKLICLFPPSLYVHHDNIFRNNSDRFTWWSINIFDFDRKCFQSQMINWQEI